MTTQAPDPDADKLSTTCLDLLLIELVPLAYRIASDLSLQKATRNNKSRPPTRDAHDPHSSLQTSSSGTGPDALLSGSGGEGLAMRPKSSGAGSEGGASASSTAAAGTDTGTSNAAGGGIGLGIGLGSGAGGAGAGVGAGGARGEGAAAGEYEDEEAREEVFYRLDGLGYRVGQGLVERFSANTPRPTQPLDMIKFLCKDLWQLVFRKQIDNLKTNHRGTFVLTDTRFLSLARMSVDRSRGGKGLEEALSRAQPFLWFPCGLLRGALSGFGLDVTVSAETTDLKSAVFQIRTVGSKL